MAANRADRIAGDQKIGLTGLLQEGLSSALVLVPGRNQPPVLNVEARIMLGFKGSKARLPEPLSKLIASSLASSRRRPPCRFELKVVGKAPVSLMATALPFRLGKKDAGVAIVVCDLSATTDFEEHLRRIESLASIGTLAAGLAHEIKNALVAGKTFIELLLEKNQDAELAQVVRREMNRIDGLVSQMLKFGAAGRPAYGIVRLHEILDHSLRLVKHQLKGKDIALSQAFHAEPDVVEGDDFQLQQAFVNLFLNALEAMGPNGTLTVATDNLSNRVLNKAAPNSGVNRQLRITIKDTGMGIPADVKDRLFEPFFTTKRSGTGLGLPITRRIIQEHRGDISVESAPNKGATFHIILPAFVEASGTKLRAAAHVRQSGAV